MARVFNGTTQNLSNTGTLINSQPFTISCWLRPNSIAAGDQVAIQISETDPAGFNDNLSWIKRGGDGSQLRVDSFNTAGASVGVFAPGNLAAGVWVHAAGVWSGTASRKCFLNGAGAADTNTLAGTWSGWPRCTVGAGFWTSAAQDRWAGAIADLAIWNVALADSQIALLARGNISPVSVQNSNLVGYWPLCGFYTPEPNLPVPTQTLSLVNAPTQDQNPIPRIGSCFPNIGLLGTSCQV